MLIRGFLLCFGYIFRPRHFFVSSFNLYFAKIGHFANAAFNDDDDATLKLTVMVTTLGTTFTPMTLWGGEQYWPKLVRIELYFVQSYIVTTIQ